MPSKGTSRYASNWNHDGIRPSRRDDIVSMAYVLIYFRLGRLPQQGKKLANRSKNFCAVGAMKKLTTASELCKGLSPQFRIFVKMANNMKFEEKPDYNGLKSLLQSIVQGKENSQLEYDWLGKSTFWQGLTFSKESEAKREEKMQSVRGKKRKLSHGVPPYKTRMTTRPPSNRSTAGTRWHN